MSKITKSAITYQAWRSYGTWGLWFRLFGYGASITNSKPLFSERQGIRRCFRIFGIKFEALS